ncbi:MAG TPA: CPBP family intramembrane glutamic endopeptidase [Rhodothermales bacterium]
MRNLFWNSNEGRPRAFWRILAQVVLMIVLLLAAGALLGDFRRTFPGKGLVTLAGIGGSVILAARWFDRRPIQGLGLHRGRAWLLDFAFGCVLGIVLMSAIFLFLTGIDWADVRDTLVVREEGRFLPAFVGALFFFLCVGITEELWMRGYLIPNLAEAIHSRRIAPRAAVLLALVLSSVTFGVLHVANPNASVVSTLGVVFAGIVLGLPFIWTGSLAVPIGLHFTWNSAQGLLYGFPVSGTEDFPSIYDAEASGPAAWTGGPFGPEAGLVSVLALILGAILIRVWVNARKGAASVRAELALPPVDAGPEFTPTGEASHAGT